MKDLILASASSRRVQLLDLADLAFTVEPSYANEDFNESLSPEVIVRKIATKKARTVYEERKDKADIVLIGADTIVVFGDHILNKPHGFDEAFSMLKNLSGKSHFVITGICILTDSLEFSFSETTEVVFSQLTDDQIAYYINKYEPYDKAGGYAIQEWIGAVGIKEIKGDYYNVMGLPINKLFRKLKGLGIELRTKND